MSAFLHKSHRTYTDQRYKLVAILEATDVLKSVALEGFELDLAEVFRNE